MSDIDQQHGGPWYLEDILALRDDVEGDVMHRVMTGAPTTDAELAKAWADAVARDDLAAAYAISTILRSRQALGALLTEQAKPKQVVTTRRRHRWHRRNGSSR